MASAMGVNAKLGIGTTSTVDQPLEFLSESLALVENFVDSAGLRGSREHRAERMRRGTRQVQGAITLTPTPLELDYLLPWITGGTKDGSGNILLAETVPARYVAIDRDVKVPVYSGVKVGSANFKASVGGPLTVTLNLIGIDETVGNSGSFPSITADLTGSPYMLSDLALTVGGTTYQCDDIDFTVDNMLEVKYFNSETPTRINAMDRAIPITISTPYGDGAALHGTALTGVAVVATFTQSTRSFTATFGAVSAPRNSAVVSGRGETMLQWSGVSRKTGSTPSVAFVNDSTV